jgi:hypothetical protein
MGHGEKSVNGLGAHSPCIYMLVGGSLLDVYKAEPLAASDLTVFRENDVSVILY